MRYIEAPAYHNPERGEHTLFLAGGITGCTEWQHEVVDLLKDKTLTIFNPRRKKFDVSNGDVAYQQVKWEFDYLRKADAILFWFPRDSLCPIALYELGAQSMTNKPLFVGVEERYQRRSDVIYQTGLVRPEIHVQYDLTTLAMQVVLWLTRTHREKGTYGE